MPKLGVIESRTTFTKNILPLQSSWNGQFTCKQIYKWVTLEVTDF